jgi:hypothetical protein
MPIRRPLDVLKLATSSAFTHNVDCRTMPHRCLSSVVITAFSVILFGMLYCCTRSADFSAMKHGCGGGDGWPSRLRVCYRGLK